MIELKPVFLQSRMPALFTALCLLSACSTWLPSAGPTVRQIDESIGSQSNNGLKESDVRLIQVDEQIAKENNLLFLQSGIPEQWKSGKPTLTLGKGDLVQISVFEAPPAVLLGTLSGSNHTDMSVGGGAGVLNLPEQIISEQGTVTVPFAGTIQAAGSTPAAVEKTIRSRLAKIANQPQAVVRLVQNQANGVVVIADGKSTRLPLTAKGERLLDVLPLAGDNKRVRNTTIKLTRNGVTRSLTLQSLSQRPENNIYLRNNDVVSVVQDPYRMTVLGAANNNTVIDFGDEGLTVAEALGRVSGLNDYRADARGIYIFRPVQLEDDAYTSDKHTVFQFDMSAPESIMLVQKFRLQDKDMLYVSNARSVHLQKILNLINMGLSPISSVTGTVTSF